ncbi:MAG: RHS repeat protein, partial [Acidobacteria bacterium]
MTTMRSEPQLRLAIIGLRGLLLLGLAAPLPLLGQSGNWCGNPVPGFGAPSPSPASPCDPCNSSRSPNFIASGAYAASMVDLEVPAVGAPIVVSRSYLSTRPVDTGVGSSWSLSLGARLYYTTYLYAAPSTYLKQADLTMPDGRRYRFTENPDGATYAAPAGRHDVLVRNPDGSWDLTLQRSRTVHHFSSTGRLETVTDDFGNARVYTYNANGRLERVSDTAGSGRYVDVYYGADGRVSDVRDSTGRQVSYAYNGDGTLASVTDAAGRTTSYAYVTGHFGKMLSAVTDEWGRVVTSLTYETSGKLKTYTEEGETFTYTYNYQNNANKVAKADSSGNTSVFTTTSPGFVTEGVAPGGSVARATYNADGAVLLATDEVGVKTEYTYDGAGRVLSVTRDQAGSTAVRFEYAYDPAFPENVASITPKNPSTGQLDPNWQGWRYDYYGAGSPAPGALHHVYRVQSDGTTLDTVATYVYDSHGRVTSQTSASGGQTDYAYDAVGNLETVTAPANNDAGTRPVTTYGHDSLGRVASVTDPQGAQTTYTYDAVGRVLTVVLPKPTPGSPLDFTTTYAYDVWDAGTGLLFTDVTDPNGKLTRLGHDQFGRLGRSVDPAGDVTQYAYNNDRLYSITDANNNVTSYSYDSRKRLQRTTFPDGAYETYLYWNDSLLQRKTDRRGQYLVYYYDGQKRLTTKNYSTGGGITYTYQGQKLTSVQDSTLSPTESHAFGYDASYRMASSSQGTRGTVLYGYPVGGGDQVASVDIQNGPGADYAYYPDESLDTIEWTPVAGTFKYTYTLAGRYSTITMPNGQVRGYSYDDQGRLTQLANTLGSNLATYAYGYDVNNYTGQSTMLGQRTSLVANVPSQGFTNAPTAYYYDSLYQLTRTDYPNAAPFNGEVDSWTYDAIGNRLTDTVNGNTLSYTYFKNGSNPLNGQRLQSVSTAPPTTYGYDAAGNVTSRTGFTFGYDAEPRLRTIGTGLTASYAYDHQSRRSSKTVSGTTSTYLYDGLNPIAETTGGQTAYFLNGPGIDEPIAMSRAGTMSYFSVDGLGSVVATNDSAGNVTHSVVFDAWGNVKAENGTRTHPFTYTGREVGEAGLHFYRARYYQPSVGRFLQEDPLRRVNAMTRTFDYVGNGPVAMADPLGL